LFLCVEKTFLVFMCRGICKLFQHLKI